MNIPNWLVSVSVWVLCSAGLLAGGHSFYILYQDITDPLWPVGYSKGKARFDRTALNQYYLFYGGSALIGYSSGIADTLSRANKHSLGHSVGTILHNHEGLGAVATCADSFDWGCMHQTLGLVLAEYGDEWLPKLKERCAEYSDEEARGNCEHGIGHGIAYQTGYDPLKLDDAMRVCDSVTTARPILRNDSCHAGAMMEYNQHLLTMEYDGLNGRPADPEAPFESCDVLEDSEHKALCIWWDLIWLHGKLYDFDWSTTTFARLGDLCRKLDGETSVRVCFQSVGRSISVNAEQPPQRIIDVCVAATSNRQMQEACVSQAVRVSRAIGNTEGAEGMCELARTQLNVRCE